MKRGILLVLILSSFLVISGCFSPEDKLAEEMKSQDPNVRIEAANQLADLGTPNAQRILELHSDDPDFQVRDKVREALRKIGKQIFMK